MQSRFPNWCFRSSLLLFALLSIGLLPAAEEDPYRAYNFRLLIAGREVAAFTECSGLSVKSSPVEYREAGQGVRKLPGPVEFGDVTLRYGVVREKALWDWVINTANGKLVRKNVTIEMLENDGKTAVFRWSLVDAWPSGWEGASLGQVKAPSSTKGLKTREKKDAVATFESLTLTFEELERSEPGKKEPPKKE